MIEKRSHCRVCRAKKYHKYLVRVSGNCWICIPCLAGLYKDNVKGTDWEWLL